MMRKISQYRSSLIAIFATSVLLMATVGCEPTTTEDGDETQEEEGVDEAEFTLEGNAQAGEEIYQRQCASCHGAEGAGDGQAGAAFDPPPSDLTQSELSPAQTFEIIRDGGAALDRSPLMTPFGEALDEQELHDVTAYTLELRP